MSKGPSASGPMLGTRAYRYLELRRLFSELLGTFFLVLVAVGGNVVNAATGGAISQSALVIAPGLMVMAIILFMGKVSGAHLNPAVTIGFSVRGDFPWRRVPGYILAQIAGGLAACALLALIFGLSGSFGSTQPGVGFDGLQAVLIEFILTLGLVSVILGTASEAQNVGPLSALAVGGYIALAGLWAAPISGASMNPVRSLAPVVFTLDFSALWIYIVGPMAGALVAVFFAYILRGPGGSRTAIEAAQGSLK
jgi:aquaporin Z